MRSTATQVDIRPISVAEMALCAGDLLRAHWEEVAKHKDLLVLDPDWPRYEAIERAGQLLALGAFEDSHLIGYSAGIVMPHLHYRGLTYYQNDVLFLDPAHRRNRLGRDLIDATEVAAAARGARFICWHAKPGTTLDRLLPRRGYDVQDVIYARKLEDC